MTKRSRDDAFLSSQLHRGAVPSPAEPFGQVQMSTASSAERLTRYDALSYLKAVKERYQEKRVIYNEFLDVMKDIKAQRIGTLDVIRKVKELFKGDRDLILGFNTFLPKGYEITLEPEEQPPKKDPVKFEEALTLIAGVRSLKMQPVNYEEALGFIAKIKARIALDGCGHLWKAFLSVLTKYRHQKMAVSAVCKEVSVLFEDHADLLEEFNRFLPDLCDAASVGHAESGKNHILRQDDRGSPMTMTRPTHMEKNVDHHDSEQLNLGEKNHMRRESTDKSEWEYGYSSDHKRKSARRDDLLNNQFHEACVQSNKQLLRSSEVEDHEEGDHDREDREKNNDRENGERDRYNRALASKPKDAPGQKQPAIKEKCMSKSIQDLDLSNCERCTPSYRLLPENYQIPIVSRRTKVCEQVLNDHWVSVTSGSEDYSFKHMRRNQYEESLFRCEDDRFELDMLLESVSATAKRVEELLESMNTHTNKIDSSFRIEDRLSALNLRCIERLYGDHGLDVMEVLRKTAHAALPVILTRLKQKQEEWARCRSDFSKIWAEIYAKNFHKSLDHRSFSFKQQDTKNLSAKALLAEIKEISEKNQSEDEMILSVCAGYRQPIKPHIKHEYPDPDIHEDLYQIIKYYCGEMCTHEQRDKVMKIWSTFLEPVLGVPSHVKDNKDNVTVKNAAKSGSENIQPENIAGRQNDNGNSDCGIKLMLNKEPQDDVSGRSTSSSSEKIKAKHTEEAQGCMKIEQEEGELSLNRNHLESNSFKKYYNTRTGGEEQYNVDEVEGRAQGSSDSENTSENCDVSTIESADGDRDDNTEGTIKLTDRFLQTVRPLRTKTPVALHVKEKNAEIFYGNDSFYLLFRLHQMLYERMKIAKVHSSSPENKWRTLNNANLTDSYDRFKDALHSLLNGSSDNAKFEVECRAIVGAQSYILLTLDKLIHKLVKQLQTVANEEMDNKLIQLYTYERLRNPEKYSDAVYYENAHFLVPEDNLYRIECVPSPTHLTIQLMKNEHEKPETAASVDPAFAAYLNNKLLSVVPEGKEKPGTFLKRNKSKFSTQDEISNTCKPMEGVVTESRLEIKVACNSLRVAYVQDTEDFLYRLGRRRKTVSNNGVCNDDSERIRRYQKRMHRLVESKGAVS